MDGALCGCRPRWREQAGETVRAGREPSGHVQDSVFWICFWVTLAAGEKCLEGRQTDELLVRGKGPGNLRRSEDLRATAGSPHHQAWPGCLFGGKGSVTPTPLMTTAQGQGSEPWSLFMASLHGPCTKAPHHFPQTSWGLVDSMTPFKGQRQGGGDRLCESF